MAAAVRQVDPDLALFEVGALSALLAESLAPERFNAFLLSFFALLAMVTAAVGLYSLLAYAVAARRHEIGIRLACGAHRRQILGMVMARALGLVAMGSLVGLVVAFLARDLVSTLIHGIAPHDPITLGFVLGLLGLTALAASAVPAYRASRLDPTEVLKDG